MKKYPNIKIAITAIFLFTGQIAFSQNFWSQVISGLYLYGPFAETNTAIFVVRENVIFKSITGASGTWSQVTGIPTSSSNYYFIAGKGSLLFAANYDYINYDGRGIYVTGDNGVTWTKKVSGLGADTNVSSIHYFPNGNMLAEIDKGVGTKLYLSTDDGNNWNYIQNIGANSVSSLTQMQNGDVLMSCGGDLYKTTNNGSSFTLLSPSLPNGVIGKIISGNDSLYATSYYNLIKSKDGINWTTVTPTGLPASVLLLSFLKTGGDTLYVGLDGSAIYYSADWGKTWTYSSGSAGQILHIFLSKTGRMFAGRTNSGIYRSNVVTTITTATTKPKFTEEFKIALSPNPVSDLAKISYNLKEPGLVSIKLMDGNGKIVKQLFEGSQSIGEHDLTINTTDLTNSTYYILIETEGKQGLEKMIIVK